MVQAPSVTAREWRYALSPHSSGQQHDSVEFLESALSKWRLYSRRNRVATSLNRLRDMINANAKIDVLAIVDVQADWSGIGRRLGICQFRHTWANSVAIDYLAVHPSLLSSQKSISGVGTALIYRVAQIAVKIGADRIWLETTDLSVDYYTHLFGQSVRLDLLIAPATEFYESLHSRFQER
jgi:hypothetical protein